MKDRKKNHILVAARSVFLRYGYKRANMADIAQAAGISRPALYLLFKNKEEIFISVFVHWVEDTVVEISAEMATVSSPFEKLKRAFEIWAVRPFELVTTLPDAHELVECTHGFARDAQRRGYARFEEAIAPVLIPFAAQLPRKGAMSAESVAHLLASAVQGFKQSANSTDELRSLIGNLLDLVLSAKPTQRTPV